MQQVTLRRRIRRRAERVLTRYGLVDPPPLPVVPPRAAPPRPAPVVAAPVAAVEQAPKKAVPTGGDFDMATVQELLDDMVRPALQSDGGDITLVKVENNDVFVRLVGACQSCPSSVMTMKNGIERLMREELPNFGELVQLGDYDM